MTRRTVDRLERFGKFLVGASRCEGRHIPTQASASKWELNDYLSLQSPSAAYPPFDEAAERSPILLTLPRQRRITAEWPTIGRDRWHRPAINYLRLFLERQWPAESAGEVAKHFQTTPEVLGREFVYRTIHIGADFPAKLPIVEQPVSNDQLILRMPAGAGADRFFACLFLNANAARDFSEDYEASWSNISALREIYPANTPRPALRLFTGRNKLITIDETDRGDVPRNVQGDLAELRWSSTAVRPVVAVGDVSRDLHPSQARDLCEARWSVSLNDENIVANVFQNNAVPARFADRLFMEIGEARKLDASGKIDPAFPDSLKGIAAVLPSGLSRVSPEDVALTDLAQDAWLLHSAGRYYRLVTDIPPGGSLSITDRKSYDQAWADGMIRGIVPIAYKQNDRTHNPTSYFEEIDLRPQVILEEYWQWQALYDEEVAKTSLAKKVLAALEAKDPKDLAYDEIIQSAELHRKLASGRYDARIALDTLRERAARLGYVLAIGIDDPVIERKDDSTGAPVKITLTPGTLYQRFERVGTYTEKVIEPWCVLHGWHPAWHSHHHYHDHYCCRHFERTITHVYNYIDYLPITITNEPWAAKRDQLTAVGFRCIMVSLRDDGYYADDGSPLGEIMRRAEADEAFRERLALFLPIFQDRLNQGRVLVKYLLVVRPSPGYSPSLTPSLFCEEELSYRAEWTGTELGELLHSVSLAPGEERTVTISRAVSQKTERIDSITSVLDVTQSQKLDLSSSLQITLQNENTSKQTSNWSANVSGSYGGIISGGASGGGSSEKTSRDFAETVRKSAMQATREMRINNKQEVKSTSSVTTTVDATEATTSKFSNINQGRSLNLMFYQVNNVYRAGIFLDNLHFLFTRSTPLIEGTEIANPTRYRFSNLREMLDAIAEDPGFSAGDLYARDDIRRLYLRKALQTVLEEYVEFEPAEEAPDDGLTDRLQALFGLLHSVTAGASSNVLSASGFNGDEVEAASAFLGRMAKIGGEGHKLVEIDDEIVTGINLLRKLAFTNRAIDSHILLTPSGATYLDAIVGARPATEEYSEQMRRLELRGREAEVHWAEILPPKATDSALGEGGKANGSLI